MYSVDMEIWWMSPGNGTTGQMALRPRPYPVRSTVEALERVRWKGPRFPTAALKHRYHEFLKCRRERRDNYGSRSPRRRTVWTDTILNIQRIVNFLTSSSSGHVKQLLPSYTNTMYGFIEVHCVCGTGIGNASVAWWVCAHWEL